jgi:hypothetical protein
MEGLCELVRLSDIERLYDVKEALAARGVDAEVWGSWSGSWHDAGGSGKLRLMVRQQDLIYARWIAYAAGIDVWPNESSDDEESKTEARPSLGRTG